MSAFHTLVAAALRCAVLAWLMLLLALTTPEIHRIKAQLAAVMTLAWPYCCWPIMSNAHHIVPPTYVILFWITHSWVRYPKENVPCLM